MTVETETPAVNHPTGLLEILDAFSHHRTVVGNDLPFSMTLMAAPPFRRPIRMGAEVAVKVARRRTRRRLSR